MSVFADRRHAGRMLARVLEKYSKDPCVTVLALPRGGVPVGYEIATRLGAPLDVFVVRKLGVPGHEELAMGAVATGGVHVRNRELIEELGISDEVIDAVESDEVEELERRERLYRAGRPPMDIEGCTAILVDDGLATGSTMRAAIDGLRQRRPRKIVVAVPIAAAPTCRALGALVDELICAVTPEPFIAVGLWYDDFSPTSDDEVRALLAAAHDHVRHRSETEMDRG
jgi:putative phosphoribosyl transferase